METKHTLLSKKWVTELIKEAIRQFLEPNDNARTTSQNLWDTMKIVLTVRFTAMITHIENAEGSQINY